MSKTITAAENRAPTAPLSMFVLDEINVRKTGGGAEPVFKASILAHGLIVPLGVRQRGGKLSVVAGGKRLASLHALLKEGKITDEYPVKFEVLEGDEAALLEASLVENAVRAPMHPVDMNAVFAKHVGEHGWTVKRLAETWLMTEKEVEGILALSRLSPKILEAWRSGSIREEAAKAFTLAPKHVEQNKVFDKLTAAYGRFNSTDVRRELGATDTEAQRFVQFVGVEEYVKAGGTIHMDLFGASHRVLSPHVAKKLADEKLRKVCEGLVASGWSWALPSGDMPSLSWESWPREHVEKRYTKQEKARVKELRAVAEDEDAGEAERRKANLEWDEIDRQAELRAFDAAAKARSGCVAKIESSGALEIRYGVIRPSDLKQPRPQGSPGEKAGERKPEVSGKLRKHLAEVLTLAAGDAILQRPGVALPLLLAAIVASTQAVAVSEGGMTLDQESQDSTLRLRKPRYSREASFPRAFDRLLGKKQPELEKMLAAVAAAALNFRLGDRPDMLKDKDVQAVCETLCQADLQRALLDRFDPQFYFASLDKAALVKLLVKLPAPQAAMKKASDAPKPVLVEVLAKVARETGWLPEELRTAGYRPKKAKKKGAAR